FFQAEDGIRDKLVTGVQTCALPISRWCSYASRGGARGDPPSLLGTSARAASRCLPRVDEAAARSGCPAGAPASSRSGTRGRARRSEERRVGKECRSRWSSEYEQEKQ